MLICWNVERYKTSMKVEVTLISIDLQLKLKCFSFLIGGLFGL